MELNKIYCEDCLQTMRRMPDNFVDSIVTDPPYGLKFMGKKWDYDVPSVEIWKEVLRVLKPGGHLLSFGGTRTYHRMVCAIEDAGFEIRDQIQWIYGSGFPKSLDISKAIDKLSPRLGYFGEFAKHLSEQIKIKGILQKELSKLFPSKTGGLTGCVWNWANGANVPTVEQWKILQPLLDLSDRFLSLIERIEEEREIIGKDKNWGEKGTVPINGYGEFNITIPSTPEAQQWEGFGTALKPANEPICLARKPLSEKNIAENVLKWGTGGLNINGCMVETEENEINARDNKYGSNGNSMFHNNKNLNEGWNGNKGRWPANVIHDGSDEVVSGFPNTKSGKTSPSDNCKNTSWINSLSDNYNRQTRGSNSGSAARFFYCAKASKSERDAGCGGMEKTSIGHLASNTGGGGGWSEDSAKNPNLPRANNHPTVKPIALMRYLCRLITPPKGIVYDPFIGSGTTGISSGLEGFSFIGSEIEKDSCNIADKRIAFHLAQQKLF